jgi:hypothetical protein
MQLEAVLRIPVGGVFLEVARQIDDVDCLKRAFLEKNSTVLLDSKFNNTRLIIYTTLIHNKIYRTFMVYLDHDLLNSKGPWNLFFSDLKLRKADIFSKFIAKIIYLHANTATDAKFLGNNGDFVVRSDLNAELSHANHRTAFLALLSASLRFAFVWADNGNTGQFVGLLGCPLPPRHDEAVKTRVWEPQTSKEIKCCNRVLRGSRLGPYGAEARDRGTIKKSPNFSPSRTSVTTTPCRCVV